MKVEHREDWIGKVAILVIQPELYSHISSEMPVEMVREWGMQGIFVSANKPYCTVEETFRKLGIMDKIIFVDCASRLAGVNPTDERVVLVNSPGDLTQLAITLGKSIEQVEHQRFLVFDSLTTLLIYSKVELLMQFAHSLGITMRAKSVTCFFLAVDQEATKEMLKFLSTIADEYVHLGIGPEGEVVVVRNSS